LCTGSQRIRKTSWPCVGEGCGADADAPARSPSAEKQRRQLRVAESLEERNPMLGLRGCRLELLRPEVYLMQARAIAQAARAPRESGEIPWSR
jgi:pyruvate, orthophosphate dikinase